MATTELSARTIDDAVITPLDGPFGIRIEGLDVSQELSEETLLKLSDLLFTHKVVVLADQHLEDAAYVRFGYHWGKPIDFFKDDHRDVVHRELIRVTNGTTVPMEHRDGAVQWHNDSSYDELPATITMLYCIEAPEEGGETLFADIIAAYEALPAEMRARIESASAWHTMLGAPQIEGEMIERLTPPPWGKYLHPIAYHHPVVPGRIGLYTSATGQSIDGMDYDEGRELLRSLRRHSFDERFQGKYKLQKNDLILWDNFSVAHSATPIEYSDEPGKFRLLQRISTKGVPTFLSANAG
jgi:taurine dioxygenase